MRCFSAGPVADAIILALDSGEDVLASIESAIKEYDIQNGVVVSGIGSLSKSRYHIVAPGIEKAWKDIFLEKSGPTEIMSIQGIIANREAHLHITLSQGDKSFGGHLEKGCLVLTLAEISIVKLEKPMKRIVNELGFGQLYTIE